MPSDGRSPEDELSRDRPSAESPSDAAKEAIASSDPRVPIEPPPSGTRRRHRRRRRRIRPTYLVAALCAVLIAGLVLAAQGSWPFASSQSEGSRPVASRSAVTPSATSSLLVAVGSANASGASPTLSLPVADGSPATHPIVANRIAISSLGIDMRIVEGDGLDAPLGKVAHYPGTAWPGGGSNIYLYAHAREGMFISLWNASIGDEIVLTLVDGSQRRYVVSRILPKVTWNDMSVLAPTRAEQLTLQTCTSYQETAPRFLVIAVPEQ